MKTASVRNLSRRQRGATLLISLIMLVVMTLFAITAIRTGNISLKIVGNQQAQKLMEAAAAQAVEQVVSNLGNFVTDPTPIPPGTAAKQRICINSTVAGAPLVALGADRCSTVAPGSFEVEVQDVRCISAKRQTGGSLTQAMSTYENTWEIVATVTDPLSGAKAIYHQGMMIRMLASSCPGVTI